MYPIAIYLITTPGYNGSGNILNTSAEGIESVQSDDKVNERDKRSFAANNTGVVGWK